MMILCMDNLYTNEDTMNREQLLTELIMITSVSGHPLANDLEVAQACAGAAHAIYTRATGDANTLPDLDKIAEEKRYQAPQFPTDDKDDGA